MNTTSPAPAGKTVNYPHIATSSTYGHWVCVVGISPTADPENLRESDFYALDPRGQRERHTGRNKAFGWHHLD